MENVPKTELRNLHRREQQSQPEITGSQIQHLETTRLTESGSSSSSEKSSKTTKVQQKSEEIHSWTELYDLAKTKIFGNEEVKPKKSYIGKPKVNGQGYIQSIISSEVKNAVEETIQEKPELEGALQLMSKLNTAWTFLENSKSTQAGLCMSAGGLLAGVLTYQKTESVTDTLVVSVLSATIVGAGYRMLTASEEADIEYEEAPTTKDGKVIIEDKLKFEYLLNGLTGVTLTGALSYKIYQIFTNNSEAKESTLQTVCDVIMAVAALIGLAGVALDPAVINSVMRTTMSISKGLEALGKLPGMIEHVVDTSDAEKLKLALQRDDKQWEEMVLQIGSKVQKHNQSLEWFSYDCIPFITIDIDSSTESEEEITYKEFSNIKMPEFKRDWPRLKISSGEVYNSFKKSWKNGDFQLIFSEQKTKVENIEDSDPSKTTGDINYVKILSKAEAMGDNQWWDEFKVDIKSAMETSVEKICDEKFQKLIFQISVFTGLIAAAAGSIYYFMYAGKEPEKKKQTRKEKKNQNKNESTDRAKCSCGKPKNTGHRVCPNCHAIEKSKNEASGPSKDSYGEPRGAKRAAGKGSKTKMRQLNENEQKEYGKARYKLSQLKDQLDDARQSKNMDTFNDVQKRLQDVTKELAKFYTPNEAQLKEQVSEARVEPSTKVVKQHIAGNAGTTRDCVTCKTTFTNKDKLIWCHECRKAHGLKKKEKSGDTNPPPKPTKIVKQNESIKKCNCGNTINETRFDICSRCYMQTKTSVKGPSATSVNQARSKYAIDYCTSEKHSCLIRLYNKGSTQDDQYFGDMCKLKKDGKAFWLVNQHQLNSDTYYKDTKGKIVPIEVSQWTKFKELGRDSLWSTPADKIQLPGITPLSMAAMGTDRKICTLYGVDPTNMKTYSCSTEVELTSDGYIAHSVSTANNFCGSILWDPQQQAVLGIHTRTDGPSNHGFNNFAAPLF